MGFAAWLKAIIDLPASISEVLKTLDGWKKQYERDMSELRKSAFIREASVVQTAIKEAKTDEDYANAAKAMRDLLRELN